MHEAAAGAAPIKADITHGWRTPLTAFAVSVYLLWFRTHGISEGFWLRGDQIRDWTIALRPFGDLPVGVPSTAGGTTIGPAYYWFLWLVARIAGPIVDDLPHAGGFGVALLQSIADGVLLLALVRAFRSMASPERAPATRVIVAIAIVLAAATSGYDATLSSTIWNPPVATAFAKLAIAVIIWSPVITAGRGALTVFASWAAVQCHTAGLIVAIPLVGWLCLSPLPARRWRVFAMRVAMTVGIILCLQIPWLIARPAQPQGTDNRIVSSIVKAIESPREAIHPGASARFVITSLHFTLVSPFDMERRRLWLFGLLLIAGTTATVLMGRDPRLRVASVGPLVTAIVLFAFLQGALDEVYWCLVLTPPAAIAVFAWIDRLRAPAAAIVGTVAVALILSVQPQRARMAWTFHRLPQYGALVSGSRSIRQSGVEVRGIQPAFELPADVDPVWLYELLGGRIDATGPSPIAIINSRGVVSYR